MNTDYRSGYGNASEDVIGCRDQTLGIVPFAFMIKAALWIELSSIFRCCGQVVLGAIDSYDRHSMPKIAGVPRPKFVGQIHGVIQDITKNDPWKLLARSAEGTAMNGLGLRPESAAACILEELTGFDVHPFVLAPGTKREDKCDQFLKG